MSIHEIYIEDLEIVEKAAEMTAAHIFDNLRSFERGEREEFDAYFPINIEGKDENGKPNGVNDIALDKFLEMLQFDDITDEYIVLKTGTKLYYLQESFDEPDGTKSPFQMIFSTQPFLTLKQTS